MYTHLFKIVGLLSLTGGALSLFLFVLKPFTTRFFGAKWQYYIWLSVLIVMALPITISLPRSDIAPTAALPTYSSQTVIKQAAQVTPSPAAIPVQNTAGKLFTTASGDSMKKISDKIPEEAYECAAVIWLSVAIAFFLRHLVSYICFLHAVHKNSVAASCPEAFALLLKSGKKGNLSVRVSASIQSPMLIGVFKPLLLLPDTALSENSLRYVLMHELTHFKRLDLLYKWFAMLINSVHWFNPMIYLVIKEINEACEISCDLAVTKAMTEQEKTGYMNTILKLFSDARLRSQQLSTEMAGSRSQIERRFKMIRKNQKNSNVLKLVSIFMAATLFTGGIFANGIFAAEILANNYNVQLYTYEGEKIDLQVQPFIKDNAEVFLPVRQTLASYGISDADIIEPSPGTLYIKHSRQDPSGEYLSMLTRYFEIKAGETRFTISKDMPAEDFIQEEFLSLAPEFRDGVLYAPSEFFEIYNKYNNAVNIVMRVYDKNGVLSETLSKDFIRDYRFDTALKDIRTSILHAESALVPFSIATAFDETEEQKFPIAGLLYPANVDFPRTTVITMPIESYDEVSIKIEAYVASDGLFEIRKTLLYEDAFTNGRLELKNIELSKPHYLTIKARSGDQIICYTAEFFMHTGFSDVIADELLTAIGTVAITAYPQSTDELEVERAISEARNSETLQLERERENYSHL